MTEPNRDELNSHLATAMAAQAPPGKGPVLDRQVSIKCTECSTWVNADRADVGAREEFGLLYRCPDDGRVVATIGPESFSIRGETAINVRSTQAPSAEQLGQ